VAQNNRNPNQNQVAIIQPPRMKMPEHVADEYALNEDSWRALTDAVFPLAKTVGAVVLALAYCKKNRLDVFQRVVHIVPMYVNGRTVETVWPGIGQLRIIGQRQDAFAGYDECEFGEEITTEFKGKRNKREDDGRGNTNRSVEDVEATVTHPTWARFTVYKMLHGERRAMPGPKVYFDETFASCSHFGGDVPNEKWARSPRQMLEKCAEAAAYRRAFPDVLGNELAAEEMEGRRLDPRGSIDAEYVVVEEEEGEAAGQQTKGPAPAGPKRGDTAPEDGHAGEDHMRGSAQTRQEGAEGKFSEREDDAEGEGHPPIEGDELFHREQPRSPLDGKSVPETDEQWLDFERLLEERVRGLKTRQAVDAEQERQQFRLDGAPLKVQQRLYAMLADAAKEKPEATQGGKR
jgi:phage recombination protein Bet